MQAPGNTVVFAGVGGKELLTVLLELRHVNGLSTLLLPESRIFLNADSRVSERRATFTEFDIKYNNEETTCRCMKSCGATERKQALELGILLHSLVLCVSQGNLFSP